MTPTGDAATLVEARRLAHAVVEIADHPDDCPCHTAPAIWRGERACPYCALIDLLTATEDGA